MHGDEKIEMYLRDICLTATNEEALREGIANLGCGDPYIVWTESSAFAMLRAPGGKLVIVGNKHRRESGPPKLFIIGNRYGQPEQMFGWFMPFF